MKSDWRDYQQAVGKEDNAFFAGWEDGYRTCKYAEQDERDAKIRELLVNAKRITDDPFYGTNKEKRKNLRALIRKSLKELVKK